MLDRWNENPASVKIRSRDSTDGLEAAETAEAAEPHLEHARRASSVINAIRAEVDQEPLEFHRLAEVRAEVEELRETDPVDEPGPVAVDGPEDEPAGESTIEVIDEDSTPTAVVWVVEAVGAIVLLVGILGLGAKAAQQGPSSPDFPESPDRSYLEPAQQSNYPYLFDP